MKPDSDFYKEEYRSDHLVTAKMKRIWAVEMELLEKFDEVCRKHEIRYYLEFGSLLGAVRHRGFVPWDNDIDVSMMRRDYMRFMEVARGEFQEPYVLQDGANGYGFFPFAKLLKSGTTALEIPDAPPGYHQGIFIDIFPLDVVPDGSAESIAIYQAEVELWTTIVDPIGMCDQIDEGVQYRIGNDTVIDLVQRQPVERYHEFEQLCLDFSEESEKVNVLPFHIRKAIRERKRDWYGEPVYLPFEWLNLPCPSHYHEVLTAEYRDYMTPIKGRSGHEKIFFDPDRSYLEYLKH
ncbi:MAG: LicD family protein [Eubacterium sp.]|nr:LicD family protein [Eubacterium sp.]